MSGAFSFLAGQASAGGADPRQNFVNRQLFPQCAGCANSPQGRGPANKRLTAAQPTACATAQWHCVGASRMVLFLLGGKPPLQQSEKFTPFWRGPALCGGAKFGMVY